MTNTYRERRNLRQTIIQERKKFYLEKIMTGELNPVETEEIIAKIVKCNEILFEIAMKASYN